MPHDPTAIRNVALVGHHGAGKTTLAEALLAATGSVARRGSVEKGTTVMDFEPEEVSRQLSISTSLAPFTVNGVKVNLLDTPGYADFAGEMVTALANVDLAVVVVSATDGVQAQTEDAWRAAARLGVPRVVVINKLDRERADFDRALAEIRASFGAGVAPVELPIGHEADFHGVIDLLDDTATHYDTPAAGSAVDGTVPASGHEGPIPDDLVDEEHTVHEQLVEGIVVGDDDLMERYLNGETLDYAELEKSLAGGVASANVFPVLCCSASSGVGVDRLARLIEELCPSPASRPPTVATAGTETTEIPCDPAGPTLLTVTKTFNDSHTGKMSLCKVVSGTLQPDAILVNSRTRDEERLHALQSIAGHTTAPATSIAAGDFVAVPRLNGTRTGDTLAPKGQPVSVAPPSFPPPALHVAVKPATRADDDKLMSALQRLCDEDPSLSVTRDDETHQTILGVNGEVHLSVTLERLERKCNVHVEREDLRIPYRETITGRPRPRASTRSSPVATASSAWPTCASSHSPAAKASCSGTRSSEGRSPASTSPPSRRASSRRSPPGASTATPWSTSPSPSTTARRTRSTPTRSASRWPPPWRSRRPWPRRVRSSWSRSPAWRSPSRPNARATCSATCTRAGPASSGPTPPNEGYQTVTATAPPPN